MLNVLFFSILVCSSVFSMQNNLDYDSSEKMKQEYEKKQNEYDKAHQESVKKIDQQMQEYHDRVTKETQEAFAKI